MGKTEWKSPKVNLSTAIIIGGIGVAAGLGIGLNWEKFSPYLQIGGKTTTVKDTPDWSSLDEVYEKLAETYDGDIDKNTVIEGAKAGLTSSLGDVYTTYMTAEEAVSFNDSLNGKVGAGIGVSMRKTADGYIRVVRTLPDNPARKAGILAGDIIYKVDGEEVYDQDSDVVVKKVRGEAGTKVNITVVRNGEEKSFDLIREEINNVSADVTYEGDTAYILTTRFDKDTGAIIEKFAKEFESKGIKKVILDLRDNGGGYVSAAVDLLALWLDGEKVLVQKNHDLIIDTSYTSRGKAILKNMKTVLLVDGGTASASEMVTGALKDYKKATVIGEKTYGKGVVQSLFKMTGNSLLKVTTAHWYTPNDVSIQKEGIEPDQEVKRTYEDINAERDPQLEAAKKL